MEDLKLERLNAKIVLNSINKWNKTQLIITNNSREFMKKMIKLTSFNANFLLVYNKIHNKWFCYGVWQLITIYDAFIYFDSKIKIFCAVISLNVKRGRVTIVKMWCILIINTDDWRLKIQKTSKLHEQMDIIYL